MPRPNKPWLRKDTGVWYATIGGKRVELARGKKNKKAAEDKFHELMWCAYVKRSFCHYPINEWRHNLSGISQKIERTVT